MRVGLPPLVVTPPATAVHPTGSLDTRQERKYKPAHPTELRLPESRTRLPVLESRKFPTAGVARSGVPT
ncbi:hypothetical protein NDU88_003946 [Pleurodeles waltl]|uniref:Uncharacterized protein n=1 Tax=Pleurodeles waltl TaxID=8319 RepID=A0AAV7SHD3_PLEWA|nr:hypothetical protein NDU88_003946 [Pleurodeles waltl]